jgi:1-acyl-sn-glycerol-3-phosphate acyltransferase
MIRQLTSMVILILWYIYVSYGYLTPIIFVNKHKELLKIVESVFQTLVTYALKYGFGASTYYTDPIEALPNKINIIVCNHMASIDMFIVLSFLKYCNITKWICLAKRELIYFPGLGVNFKFGDHIKVARNFEEDKVNIIEQLEKIKEGTIIMFPEGTRFNPEKFKEGQQFSKDNGLPIFDNLLVPKTKGLWLIYNYLKENNKLGNVYDISIVVQNFLGKKAHIKELLLNRMGDIFLINRKINIPDIDDMIDFKLWFLQEWKKKDILINYNQKLIYQKMNIPDEKILIYSNLLFMSIITYEILKYPYFRYYFILSFVLANLMTMAKVPPSA